jgi:hypothetical protein
MLQLPLSPRTLLPTAGITNKHHLMLPSTSYFTHIILREYYLKPNIHSSPSLSPAYLLNPQFAARRPSCPHFGFSKSSKSSKITTGAVAYSARFLSAIFLLYPLLASHLPLNDSPYSHQSTRLPCVHLLQHPPRNQLPRHLRKRRTTRKWILRRLLAATMLGIRRHVTGAARSVDLWIRSRCPGRTYLLRRGAGWVFGR